MSTLILCFHRVADQESGGRSKLAISPDDFRSSLDTVGQKYDFVSLADGVKPSRERRAVVTFDDGYADNLHTAAPVLKERDIPATFFLTTGYIDTQHLYPADALDGLFDVRELGEEVPATVEKVLPDNYWDALESLSALSESEFWDTVGHVSSFVRERVLAKDPFRRPMTLSEVNDLSASGFTLASHTHSHRRLTALKPEAALDDVRQSLDWFSAHGFNPVPFFAYPFGQQGDVSEELTTGIRGLGLEPLTTVPTLVTHRTVKNFYSIGVPRLSVGPLEVPQLSLLTQIFPLASAFPGVWLALLALRRKLLTPGPTSA
jgi:peptidoglycan/xylan/chitin deacetylase (PgdA/CDA1 family)